MLRSFWELTKKKMLSSQHQKLLRVIGTSGTIFGLLEF
jgi:hypothetical protein